MLNLAKVLRVLSVAALAIVVVIAIGATSANAQTTSSNIMEQYKAYVTDLESIGSRYTTSQTFYLAIVSALLAMLSFKETTRTLHDYLSPGFIAVFLLIVIICYLWWDTLEFYRDLFRAKFAVLREMETKGGLFTAFAQERELFCRTRGSECPGLIATESRIAIVIGVAALLGVIAGVVYQIFGPKPR